MGTGRRVSRLIGLAVLCAVGTCLCSVADCSAQDAQAVRRELSAARNLTRRAADLQRAGKLEEAAAALTQSQERLTKLLDGAADDVRKQAQPTWQSIQSTHAALQLEGVTLPSLQPLTALMTAAESGPSFTGAVAPILTKHCGRCHIERQEGGLSIASFNTLMNEAPGGAIVLPGDAEGSRLVDVIESGDMPRGGGKLSPPELETLRKWIAAGAKFDGTDPNARLVNGGPAAPPRPTPPAVQRATGDEKVSFSRDLAGVLVERCLGCHGGARNVRAQFNLSTFSGLLRGGDNGPPIKPGGPAESLLIQKLKGTGGGERMPQGGPPLSAELIAQFETWIQEGARFDRADANQSLEIVAATARAELATHEQLRADRDKRAADSWRVVLPDSPAERVQSTSFLSLGNVSDRELSELSAQAETLVPRIVKLLKLSSDAPPLKGGATLYFFRTGYDYGEFGRMVEKRELPAHWRAHFGYDVVDAYAAFHLTGQDGETRETVLVQQIASLYVAAQGSVPNWFAQGVGRAVAARLVNRSPLAASWLDSAQAALPKLQSPGEFLQGRPSVEEAELLSYRYADFLMSDMRRFQKLLESVRAGRPFAESFEQAYGGSPEQVAVTWFARESQRGKRGR